ncbi:excalibur calcium-binding domain-containing protein [Acuticoccus sp. M5D2P5]|uniref:excalibur calcium-binding domain-containing protein n=1 Tax=Acuticoccus kalidii TaxID=2910977 RepID=UPI001F40F766|nr:excalibur calcium-binding domain-containing protein [Acuticoccus kalidii]MCF3935464.1 excalibur calcium-binding domain-containing protein [Acuticoccus kalidii]
MIHFSPATWLRLAIALAVTTVPGAAVAATCKDYSTCREAVVNWCAGRHARADGDGDGIPCENVCGSRAEVEAIMREIGCNR